MKKILLFLATTISFITLSFTTSSGIYNKEIYLDNKFYKMDIIMKNNKILSVSFDIKDANGRSLIFGNAKKMQEREKVEKELIIGKNVDKIYILDKKTTEIIKKMYYDLVKNKLEVLEN